MNLLQRRIGGAWFFTMIVLAFVSKIESLTADEKDQMEKGLTAGKEILGYIKDRKFTQTMTILADSASQFLGALGPFVSFVMTFVSGDSAELTYMKEMMKEIDRRFGMVDSKLEDIQALIEWSNFERSLRQIELNVQTMDRIYKNFYEFEGLASDKKRDFSISYESSYDLSGSKLYELAVKESSFTDSLSVAIMKKTKYDRKQTNDYLLGILKIILQGMRIELAYSEMQYGGTFYNSQRKEWERRIVVVSEKFKEIDDTVTKAFLEQSKKDTKKIALDNRPNSMGNLDFSVKVCNKLKEKYYWRDWFCAVWDDDVSSNEFSYTLCGGFFLRWEYGRNILVSSRDKTAPRMNVANAKAELNKFEFILYVGIRYDGTKIIKDFSKANPIFDVINVNNACCIAVIKKHANTYWHKSDYTRLATKDLYYSWWLVIFG
ncbi:unnamed protein product [Owenia fusiformis]|uniref:Uncharacterized protein n=1 Tax=Owenia fusiformis TaxID=6347 RepID=A0A8S4PWT0_OWEFU|nr:unnamed protein product [Owenia fusiformis]